MKKIRLIHLTVPVNFENPTIKMPMCGAQIGDSVKVDDANEFMDKRAPRGFHKCPKCKAEVLSWSK